MSESIRTSNLFSGEDYKKIFKAYQYIDYTDYDFDTLKQALINYIQTYYPESFNDYIESSEFIAIIELLAYFGTSLAFRTDLNSRENFIDTAERRESVIRLAQMVNYVPRRNIAASGLFKIAAVQTDQPLVDANGININDLTIYWNDPNNPDWFDQFIQICNAAFSSLNPFGRPTKSGVVGSIPTDLYQLNNIPRLNIAYPIVISINGQQYPLDICNPDFVTQQTIFERDPDPSNAFNFIYRNDSLGVASPNTGFFLYFRQGNITNIDTNFEFPVPNRVFPIDIQNINQDDVYVQETDEEGNVINKWLKVPAIAGENIIYNSIQFAQRNIFSVLSGTNDTVSVRFADGNFGNVPTGLFRFWIRPSANEALIIRPDNAQGLQINIPYIGVDQQSYTIRIIFNLEQTIGNAAPSETDEQIKLRAPEVFSTQSRMVNGSDYNILPLIYGNQIAKLQAIDRIYSGQSRYIDLNDPTGFHRDLIIFGQDGALYRDNKNVLIEVTEDSSNSGTIEQILVNTIQEMLRDPKVSAFFYDSYIPQFESTIRVNPPNTGRSLLDLVPTTPFMITSISGNGSIVTANYIGPAVDIPSTIIISGVTGQILYNGVYSVNTSATGTLTYNSVIVGAGIVTNATISIDPSQPLFWKTSPQKFKNDTGYFTSSTSTSAPAVPLVNTLNPNNISGGTYQPWSFIQSDAVLEFAKNSTDTSTLNVVSVINVIQSGLPLIVNPLNPYANIGPVELSLEEQNNYQARKVYPIFRNTLTAAEINGDTPNGIYGIVPRILDGISFYMFYDVLQDVWNTSTAATPGLSNQSDQPFVYPPPKVISGQEQIYSDWASYSNSGMLYIAIASNNQLGTTTYDLTARGRVYVFESYRDVRFYWEPNQIIIDNASGLALQDNIEIMPFVNTNNSINNNDPNITNPATAFLPNQVVFNITGVFTQNDGYVDPSRVEVSLVDINNDGIPDDPEGFDNIVAPDDRIVFEYYNNEVTGYQNSRPWVSRWSTDLQDTSAENLYVYFPVQNPTLGTDTTLYSSPFIANVQFDPITQNNYILDPGSYSAINYRYIQLDTADLIFINNISQILFDSMNSSTISIANQVSAFFNNNTTTFPWMLGTGANIQDKSSILTNNFYNKVFLIYGISPPGFGIYYTLSSSTTANSITYPLGIISIAAIDTLHFDKNGKIFTQNSSISLAQQLPLYFKWSHFSPIDQRVDPSATNIIDMIIITDSYYRDMTIWKNSNGTLLTQPLPPTTEELRIQFQDLDQYKMLSDNMIWNSGQFKILFGPQASAELQATFKVVKAPSTNISDNEVKTKVIQTIDLYFDIRNWDFGETFFYTELAAFIHQQLSQSISSIVIVPNNASSEFGNLFEIVAGPTELFMSTATVNNVSIVANLTNQNLRM